MTNEAFSQFLYIGHAAFPQTDKYVRTLPHSLLIFISTDRRTRSTTMCWRITSAAISKQLFNQWKNVFPVIIVAFLVLSGVWCVWNTFPMYHPSSQNSQLVYFRLTGQPGVNSADEEAFRDRSQSERSSSAPHNRYLAWFIICSDLHEVISYVFLTQCKIAHDFI